MINIAELKKLNTDALLAVEEVVAKSAEARALAAEFDELGVAVPFWLEKACATLREEVVRRTKAADQEEMDRLKNEIANLRTAAERKRDAETRLSELMNRHGQTVSAGGKRSR
jgi:hypothetical protein